MNRTFLIFLMIGTALMIMVMGDKNTTSDINTTPWDITIHENGNIRIFGITLGKTTIQDASQILASFPETRLMTDTPQPRLVAAYEDLNIGGFIANIELNYALDENTLKELQNKSSVIADKNYALLDKSIEIALLSTVIDRLLYRPSIDYDIDIILQRFGQPENEVRLTDTVTRMTYPDIGLVITLDNQGPELFEYHSLDKSSAAETANK